MEIRPILPDDAQGVGDIDGTIESARYLHVERAGEGNQVDWRLEERPLREKLILRNPISDDVAFMLRQIAGGADEGLALMAEHEGVVVAALLAHVRPGNGTLRVLDLRVDCDYRRQGLASALLYQAIREARDRGLRAVTVETLTNNYPAGQLLLKTGFELAGLDVRRHSNHDLVKEAVSLFWYAALD